MHNVWLVNESDFPVDGTMNDKISFWLRYAVLAPSAHNTQPWRVEIVDDRALIFRDPGLTLQDSDATLRETFLGLGAFLENLIVAATHWNYTATVESTAFTTAELQVAAIHFEAQSEALPTDADLFKGIVKRHTNRGHYDSQALPENTIEALQVPTEEAVSAVYLTDAEVRARIAHLVGVATQMALSVNTMKRELAELTFREHEQKSVGMMVEALTETPPDNVDGSTWTMQYMDPAEHGRYWQDTFAQSPLHVLVGSKYDGPEAWLSVSRTMERILLKAAALGLSHCIAAGPVEVPTLLPELRKEMDAAYRPQALFRLGYPLNESFTRHSTRRPVEAVVSLKST